MYKRIIISLLSVIIAAPVLAQAEWQIPQANKQKSEIAAAQKSGKKKLDPKYAAGAVPEVDGRVMWVKDIAMPGKSAKELYEKMQTLMEEFTHSELQYDLSRLVAVNPNDHIIASQHAEEMTFSTSIIQHDFTEFKYTLVATCTDGNVNLQLGRIVYNYNLQGKVLTHIAEQWITDKACLKKSGKKLFPSNGKFRKKTIDRVEEIFNMFAQRLNE